MIIIQLIGVKHNMTAADIAKLDIALGGIEGGAEGLAEQGMLVKLLNL